MDEREETPPSALDPKFVSDATDGNSPSALPRAEFSWSVPDLNPWYASAPGRFLFEAGPEAELASVEQQAGSGETSSDAAQPERILSRREDGDDAGARGFVRQDTSDAGPERGQGRQFDRDGQARSFDADVASAEAPEPYAGPRTAWKTDSGGDTDPTLSLAFTPLDDLFDNEQWHLLNTGQFSGVPGLDINVTKVWDDYTGTGIRVGVVDDGVQYTHHDLDDNYNFSGQFDYSDNDSDPFPTASDPHGTAVAGLIAAENNGSGAVGVAFDASVTAFRIFPSTPTEAEYADIYNRHATELDVSNNSWGYNGFFFDDLDGVNFDSVGLAIENAAANGRGGLGTVMLWAAGNDRGDGQDVNYHGFQNARETFAVAAITNQDTIASYSTPGAAILVGSPSNGGTRGITTTDQLGSNGYASGDYTLGFGGTSAATPITAGAVALILESNPLLGYRDVQEILAYTARQADMTDPGWEYNGAHNWNGGGLHTSHDFGFGLIDTLAAVRLAETWTVQSTAANESLVSGTSAPSLALIDNGTVSDTITIGGGIDIEHVEVVLDLTHTWIGDLVITLTSPDGTESVLVNRPGVTGSDPNGSSQDNIDFTLSSTHHWGEIGTGDWTLEIQDQVAQDTGVLVSWTLNLFGTALSDDDFYVYTDEFGGFTSDAGRKTLSDAAGADVINAAAITTGSFIDLNDGSDSTLAGNTLTIDTGTIIEDAYSGDGGDSLLGNAVANLLSGGRGDDTLTGAGGNDTLDGGEGDDLFVIGASEGDDVILGLEAGAGLGDQVDLQARSDVADFAELLGLASDDGTDTTIAFANGDSLVLNGVLESELAEDDFLFGNFNGDPVAVDDNAAATEDVPVTILASALLANDSDPDLDPLTIQSVQNAVNGTATLDVNGDVAFAADADFNGDATFDYTVSDGNGGTDTATVTVAVAAVNDDPVAVDDNAAATEDTPVTILASSLLTNDSDVDGDPLTIQSVQNAVNGTATLDVNGDVAFAADADFNGNATFDYTVSDGNGGTDTATVTVAVAAVNDDPVAVDDNAAATEDTPVTILASSLLTNDSDIDGDPLTIQSVQNAVNGTATLDVNGDVAFAADADFNGDATFDYTVSDGNGGTDTATVTVAVAAVNDDPVAVDDNAATTEDVPVTILSASLLSNDTDVEGDTLALDSVQSAVNGTVSLDVNGDVLFTPDAGFFGEASFQYTAIDGNGGSGSATVTVDVAESSAGITLIGGSGKDTLDGSEGDDLIIGNGGIDLLLGNGGNDTFQYSGSGNSHDTVSGGDGVDRIEGGAGDDVIGLRTFSGVNTVEEIDGGAGVNVIEGHSGKNSLDFSNTSILNIDSIDGGGGADTITGSSASDVIIGGTGNDQQFGGAGDDRFLFFGSGNGHDTVSGGIGTDRIEGGAGDDVIGLRTFTGANVVEEIDGGLGVNVIEGHTSSGTFDFSNTTLLNIDSIDGGGGKDTIIGSSGSDVIIGGAKNDRLSGGLGFDQAVYAGLTAGYSITDNGDGTYTVSDIDASDGTDGTDTIDGFEQAVFSNGFVALATGENDPPVAVDDNETATEDVPETILAATLLSNDSDPESDPLTLLSVQNAVNGTASLDLNGDVAFTPDADFNGNATFEYTIGDTFGGTSTATVTVAVASVNDDPVAAADNANATVDTPETIFAADLLTNDTDVDGDVLTITSVQNAVDGTALLDVNGDVLFTPDPSFTGQATFEYTASDGNGGSSSATVTVSVNPPNDPPVAVADNAVATEDVPVTILASALLSNDSDPDSDPLTLLSVQNAVSGTASLDLNGDVLFTPDADFNGFATFDYTIGDGNGGTASATVTVDVASVNDDPVAVADNAATTKDVSVTILASTLLSNDSDADLDTLTLTSVQNAVNGTASLDVNGDVLFTPGAGFDGQATFEYTVDDGNLGTASATVTVDVVNLDQTLVGDSGKDTLVGGEGNDTITGNGGIDLLIGNGGDDLFLYSGSGNSQDTVSGGAGFDRIEGSAGDDVIGLRIFSGVNTVEEIDGGLGVNVVEGHSGKSIFDFSNTVLLNIASIEGGGGGDTITGSSGADTIVGGSANDVLAGGVGDDAFLVSGSGDGFDTFTGGDGIDRILGGSGDDVIGLRTFTGVNSVEEIDGGSGTNTILGHTNANVLDFSGTTLTNIASIDGGAGSDTITGTGQADTIIGNTGNDVLFGADGDDRFLFSGSGNGHDTISGGNGTDRIEGSAGDDTIGLRTFSGANTVEEIDGGTGVNVIEGHTSASVLDFSGTSLLNIDTIDGGGGKDTITGSSGDDVIQGGDNNDILDGGAGNDRFIFRDNDDNDTINNFAAGAATDDAIDFAAVAALTDFASVQANATDDGSDTTIDYGTGSVVLIGVQVANLHEDDFIF